MLTIFDEHWTWIQFAVHPTARKYTELSQHHPYWLNHKHATGYQSIEHLEVASQTPHAEWIKLMGTITKREREKHIKSIQRFFPRPTSKWTIPTKIEKLAETKTHFRLNSDEGAVGRIEAATRWEHNAGVERLADIHWSKAVHDELMAGEGRPLDEGVDANGVSGSDKNWKHLMRNNWEIKQKTSNQETTHTRAKDRRSPVLEWNG